MTLLYAPFMAIFYLLLGFLCWSSTLSNAFQVPSRTKPRTTDHCLTLLATAVDRLTQLYPNAPSPTLYDQTITSVFPGALSNKELVTRVVGTLSYKGFEPHNTLVGTSLCSDETARQLQDDFTQIYGSAFNLGGLAGFPFAGNIGMLNMGHHIPDDGGCGLIVYGPHVGLSQTTGDVGMVERAGVTQVETCCTSAIQACQHLMQQYQAQNDDQAEPMPFNDLQQAAVEQQITPYMETLMQSDNALLDLPYILFYSQNDLWNEIIQTAGRSSIKSGGLAMLGGIQINTAPGTLDYFLPLRFDYLNSDGQVVEDMLDTLRGA